MLGSEMNAKAWAETWLTRVRLLMKLRVFGGGWLLWMQSGWR